MEYTFTDKLRCHSCTVQQVYLFLVMVVIAWNPSEDFSITETETNSVCFCVRMQRYMLKVLSWNIDDVSCIILEFNILIHNIVVTVL